MARGYIAAARRTAVKAGFSVSEGSYRSSSDDCSGRFYLVHETDTAIDRRGTGFATRGEAWVAACAQASARDANLSVKATRFQVA